mmetsp:Transcript_153281/g.293552  ORF Transcript_153281/g.293552 Transcript_153281/m.293552 type:complete len:191 (-) Transcript_153281:302-874(-)
MFRVSTACNVLFASLALAAGQASQRGFCEILSRDLPSKCGCADAVRGGTVNCTLALLEHDRIGVRLDVRPCDEVAHVNIAVIEASHGINFTVAGVRAGQTKEIPVPGLAVYIPHLGNAGLDVSVRVEGNLDELHMEVGLNACVMVAERRVCGSQLTRHLPLWILKGSYAFGKACEARLTSNALLENIMYN